ncbi:MAG: isoprenyl transferase [Lachnospiraceae bacterium]|nr:isoprenyl transferase [Lachnospiraceae bacterium]
MRIPKHIAVILDGNGRWAKKRNLPRLAGHKQGAQAVEDLLQNAKDLGVKYVTVYAFSTENWNRPQDEVDGLMDQLRAYLKKAKKSKDKRGGRVKVIGDKSRLSEDIVKLIDELEKATGDIDDFVFTIALNYGGRDELVRAVKKMLEKGLKPEELDEATFGQYLDTYDLPDPDLLIRTSGENRLSNFLPWQLAYSEFYFPKVLWPDFSKADLIDAIEEYNKRDRRYGKVKEEE